MSKISINDLPEAPTHALHALDNFCGDAIPVFVFAVERDGVFYHHENGRPVLEYEGDKVLQSWPLT